MAAPMSTSMDFKEQIEFPIKCIVIHIKYRDTYRLWKKCIVTPLLTPVNFEIKKLDCIIIRTYYRNVYLYISDEQHYSFIETSALDSTNVGEAFNNLLVGMQTI